MRRAWLGMVLVLLGAVLLLRAILTPRAATAVGQARVIDADTLEIGNRRIRLLGVDAPDRGQICRDATEEGWPCGAQARLVLADFLGTGTVSCRIASWDRYDRDLGHCALEGADLGDWLVRHGWAIPHEDGESAYEAARRAAEARRKGLWIGTFDPPSAWRRTHAPTRYPKDRRTP